MSEGTGALDKWKMVLDNVVDFNNKDKEIILKVTEREPHFGPIQKITNRSDSRLLHSSTEE